MKPTFFRSAVDLRRWFEKHHATVPELQMGFYKKALGRGITYPEALDEALCSGWIDSIRRGIDAESYTIRFTPRKPRSNWSAVNIQRVQVLISQGLMQPSGLQVFHGAMSGRLRGSLTSANLGDWNRRWMRLCAPT